MAEVFGLTAEGVRRTAETNRRVLGELAPAGRRTRRVFPPGGGGGGGVTEIVRFRILSVCPGTTFNNGGDRCDCVQGVITRVVCGSSLQPGDLITVWAIDCRTFTIPEDMLIDQTGTAILMRNDETSGAAPNCTGYGALRPEDCFWMVEYLNCCTGEVYAA